MTGLSGFNDLDGSVNRIAGSWTVPAGQADGAVMVTFAACNVVSVCATIARAFSVDRTPPSLSWASPPPQYVASYPLTLGVVVTDSGAGVAAVYAQVGNGSQVSGNLLPNGSYSVPLRLQSGPNSIAIWAVDSAGNSGQGQPRPQQLTVSITADTVGPAIGSPDTAVSKYFDETSLALKTSAPDLPLVPAQYIYAGGLVSAPSGTINKVSTRLGWTQQGLTQPPASELTGSNPNNYPFYYFTITSLSGVTSTAYSIKISQNNAVSTGTLWPVDATHFVLPITSDTIPGLLSLGAATAPFTLQISVAATSGSGVTSNAVTFTQSFSVLGAPLNWGESFQMLSSSFDSSSTYRHLLSDGSYASMFPYLGTVKLARYIVKNPAAVPVAFKVTGSGAWQANEIWADGVAALPTNLGQGQYTAPDGSTLANPLAVDAAPQDPCVGVSYTCSSQQYAFHNAALDPRTPFACAAKPVPASTTLSVESDATSAISFSAFTNPQTTGGETTVPATTSDGYFIVPAASGGQAGSIVVYVTRPGAASRQTPLDYQDIHSDTGTAPRFESWLQDFWTNESAPLSCGTDQRGDPISYFTYATQREVKYLYSARDSVSGALSFTTAGLNANSTTALGLQTTIANAVNFTRNINH
jgi:hypothetical protein